jgi:preprotein translocase subunit YajC
VRNNRLPAGVPHGARGPVAFQAASPAAGPLDGNDPMNAWSNPDSAALLALAPGSEGGSSLLNFMVFPLIFAIFYFLVFAPMRKKQRLHSQMLDALAPGDRVLTNGGIYGRVVELKDQIVHLRVADKVTIEVARNHVAEKVDA